MSNTTWGNPDGTPLPMLGPTPAEKQARKEKLLAVIVGENPPAEAVKIATARWPNYDTDPEHGRAVSVYVQGWKAAAPAPGVSLQEAPGAAKLDGAEQAAPSWWSKRTHHPDTDRLVWVRATAGATALARYKLEGVWLLETTQREVDFPFDEWCNYSDLAALKAAALPQYQQERGGAIIGLDFKLNYIIEQLTKAVAQADKDEPNDGYESLYRAAAFAIPKLRHLAKAAASPTPVAAEGSGWVSVDERLPEFGERVLLFYGCALGKKRQTAGSFAQSGINGYTAEPDNVWVNSYEPTHWQPLPAAPSQKGADHA